MLASRLRTQKSDSLGKLSEFSLWKDESSPVYRDQRKDGMGRTLIRAGHLPEGWVCQSDRSWLGRAISWLSSLACIQEGKQNVFEWLYGRLGNSRFRGCMYWDVVQPPFGCTWNPMWVAYEHTEPRSTDCDSVSLPPDCTYVIRVRYANDSAFGRAVLKVGFKSAISQLYRYYF